MKYMLMIYGNEAARQAATPAQMGEVIAAYKAYTEALSQAGVLLAVDRLQPSATATTVRLVSGKTEVLNGPYAETKEQLGGYYLIDVPDLDAALEWAKKMPNIGRGTMEVRPVVDFSQA